MDRPLLGLDLLRGSTVGQCGAVTAILMLVWALAHRGAAGHRASVVAAAVSATLAQPLLNLIDEPVIAASAQLDSSHGWLSGLAVALVYSGIAVGLLVSMDTARSAVTWLARTIIRTVHLLVAIFARHETVSTPHQRPITVVRVPVRRTWIDGVRRRGPPRARRLAGI